MNTTSPKRIPTLTVSLACIAALAASAAANVTNMARVSISPNTSGGTGPVDHIVSHPGACSAADSATGGFNSSGNGSCYTNYGVVRMSGSAVGGLHSVCSSIIRDTITITSPGIPNGTPGTLTYGVRITGTLGATSGFSDGRWLVQAFLGGGTYQIAKSGIFRSPESFPSGYVQHPFGVYTATISFTYGTPLDLDIELSGTATASNSFTSSGAATFGYPLTLTWNGIQNVRANGNPVATFTASSESGTGYTGAYNLCIADIDDGSGTGTPDGGVGIEDLLYYLSVYNAGSVRADVDDGSGTGIQDGGVGIEDLLYFLTRYNAGC